MTVKCLRQLAILAERQDILSFISSVFFVCLFFLIVLRFPDKNVTFRMMYPTQTPTRPFQLCLCLMCASVCSFFLIISSFWALFKFARSDASASLAIALTGNGWIRFWHDNTHRNLIRKRSVLATRREQLHLFGYKIICGVLNGKMEFG